MNLPPFLLGQWLEQKHSAEPPVEYDLGSSTGPVWTLRELLSLGGDIEQLLDTKLFCMPSHGSPALRAALAGMASFGMPAHFRIGFAAGGETFARALEKFSDLLKNAKTLGQPA